VAGAGDIDARAVDLAGVRGLAAPGAPTAVTYDEVADLLHEATQRIEAGAREPAGRPGPHRPLLLLVVSDLHLLLRHARLRDLLGWVARAGGECGVGVAAHVPTAGSPADRWAEAVLCGGNRAEMPVAGRTDAAGLPRRWHTGVSTAGVGHTTHRDTPFRAYRTYVDW
jgi:hypothetical protein